MGRDRYPLRGRRLAPPRCKIGVADQMWAERLARLTARAPARRVLAGPVLRELRMRKEPDEVAALREAGAAIDRVHARMGEWLRPGRTEREVGADIARAIIDEGHVTVDFVIVGSGPNGATPHHEVSDRVIEAGEPVVVDIGGTMPAGYCSDSTRNYSPSERRRRVPRGVRGAAGAQQRSAGRPSGGYRRGGRRRGPRDVADAGYGDHFIHRTGHGIGLETHEEPYIVAGNNTALEPGMAFSVEPGIYLPDATAPASRTSSWPPTRASTS